MEPLLGDMPLIGALSVFFLKKPVSIPTFDLFLWLCHDTHRQSVSTEILENLSTVCRVQTSLQNLQNSGWQCPLISLDIHFLSVNILYVFSGLCSYVCSAKQQHFPLQSSWTFSHQQSSFIRAFLLSDCRLPSCASAHFIFQIQAFDTGTHFFLRKGSSIKSLKQKWEIFCSPLKKRRYFHSEVRRQSSRRRLCIWEWFDLFLLSTCKSLFEISGWDWANTIKYKYKKRRELF